MRFGVSVLPAALALAATCFASGEEGPVAQRAGDEEAALVKARDALLAEGSWAKALPIAEKVNDLAEPRHVEALLAVARCHARSGHSREALDWLKRAADAGIVDVWAVRKDEAFASLRADERYKAITRAMWVKAYIAMLERPGRDSFQKPDEVMKALALRRGERVADVGAGSGYFTVRAARAVGPVGSVLAVDIAPELLEFLGERAKAEGLTNVRTVKVEKDDPRLPPSGVDTVLMVDTLHYMLTAPERAAYAKKLRAGLAPGGRVVVIDYLPKPWEERPWGPPPEQKMSKEEVDEAMAAAGLVPRRVHTFLPEQFFVEYGVAGS
jgi:ubiquinone/menaquinone biosynthesis C-methylase UbiE